MEQAAVIDIDAYLARLGYAGPAEPTLETLCALHRRHPLAIPFENLTTLLGESPALDLEALQKKMVSDRRGGYCFEHNRLFAGVLEALGFEITGLAARVMWERDTPTMGPRTHMLLLIELSGRPYIGDVGFGGLTLTAPLRLEPGLEQTTPHETFRLLESGTGFMLEARLRGEWRPLYWFDVHAHLEADFEVLNHYVATHPDSPFRSTLYCARALPDGRLGLRNDRLTVHRLDGTSESRQLGSVEALRAALKDQFGISLPAAPGIGETLARLLVSS